MPNNNYTTKILEMELLHFNNKFLGNSGDQKFHTILTDASNFKNFRNRIFIAIT